MKHFEIYLQKQSASKDDWQKLYLALVQFGGKLKNKFTIIQSFDNNLVRYFIKSDKDLGPISSGLDNLLLRPISENEFPNRINADKSERFMQFVTGGGLLELKEKYEVSKGKQLVQAEVEVRVISVNKAKISTKIIFKDSAGGLSSAKKSMLEFPAPLFVYSENNTKYILKTIEKYLDIEKSLSLLASEPINPLFTVDGFPYTNQDMYINLNGFEFDKHSFIVGASGSGKSKLIGLYIDRLAKSPIASNYRVVVVDPHASLVDDLSHINDSAILNFNSDNSAELFSETPQDIQATTELTTILFKSVIGADFNSHLERLLRYSLYVLFTGQSMTLDNLKRFLGEQEYRNNMVEHVKDYVPTNVAKFFGGEFNEIRTKYYDAAFAPIVSIVDEMQMQPGMTGEGGVSMQNTIQNNFLTVFSLNKVSMGEKVVKTVAGLIIQQIFLLAQGRAFKEKVMLIVDEVSVVQNPALAQILAEARKFNLHVVLTQQYFGQIDKTIRDAIFANVSNYYTFKVSEEDARLLEGNLSIELPKSLLEIETAKGLKESDIRVKIMTELNPRECLVRLAAHGQILPVVKARTVDAEFLSQQHGAVNLQPVKQAKLPEKFDESKIQRPTKELPSTPASVEVSPAQVQPVVTEGARDIKGKSSLSEILSKTSSSRFLVNKDKQGK